MKTVYEDPSTIRVLDPPALPQSKICGGKQDFTKFVQREDQANGVGIFGEDEFERDDDGNVIVSGFFSVWKSLLQDRTITSR